MTSAALEAGPFRVTEPGLYAGLDDRVYHADPVPGGSLSVSAAKLLITATPAHFKWDREHRRADTAEFDLGHAAHQLVLGTGPKLVRLEADDWRSSKTRAIRDEMRAKGAVPLLAKDHDVVIGMARSVRNHPEAGRLLYDGTPEVSAFAQDPLTRCWLRGRFDWLRNDGEIVDYKTILSADPGLFGRRSAIDYGYYMQAAWYIELANLLGVEVERFRFVLQEKKEPFHVSVVDLDERFLAIGRRHMRQAIDLFVACLEADSWPGYPAEVVTLTPPPWFARQNEVDAGPTTIDPDLEQSLSDLIEGMKE